MIKLGIEDSAHTANSKKRILQQIADLPTEAGKKPSLEGLIVIFLERFWKHAKEKLTDRVSAHLNIVVDKKKGLECVVDLECVFCVPAMWNVETRQRMCNAASEAGLPEFELTTEPEAAGIYLIHEKMFQDTATDVSGMSKSVEILAPFLVVDVGGGTGVCGCPGLTSPCK